MTIEEQLEPYVRHLHDQMRMMYAIPPVNVLSTEKLKEVKKMEAGPLSRESWSYIDPGRLSREEEIKFARDLEQAAKGKTLLSKPHPEECICPKCSSHPAHVLPAAVRIGDAERDETLALLDERLASGHITLAEFQARADAVLATTRRDELDHLVRDLPPVRKVVRAPAVPPARTWGNSPWWYVASALVFFLNAGFSGIVAGSWMLTVIFLACSVSVFCLWLAKR